MASEIFDDIRKLFNDVKPKVEESMSMVKLIDEEVKHANFNLEVAKILFSKDFASLDKVGRMSRSKEIEDRYIAILAKSQRKCAITSDTYKLICKYKEKISDLVSQMKERMDCDYPKTSALVDQRVRNITKNVESCSLSMQTNLSLPSKNESNSEKKPVVFNYKNMLPTYAFIPKLTSANQQLPPLTALNIPKTKNITSNKQRVSKNSTKNVLNTPGVSKKDAKANTATPKVKKQRKRKKTDTIIAPEASKILPALSNTVPKAAPIVTKTAQKARFLTEENNSSDSTDEEFTIKTNNKNSKPDETKQTSLIKTSKANNINKTIVPDVELIPFANAQADQELFCICRQPSYGEMIACESEKCQIAWFHLECVGLKIAPEGDWFCDSCLNIKH